VSRLATRGASSLGGGGTGPRSGGSGSAGVAERRVVVRGSRGSAVAGGRDGVASATRVGVCGDVLPGDVDGVPGVGLPSEAGVDGVAVDGAPGVEGEGVAGEEDSTGRGVVVVGFVAPGVAGVSVDGVLGSADVPGAEAEGALLSVAPG
jgi:hypothetical protein